MRTYYRDATNQTSPSNTAYNHDLVDMFDFEHRVNLTNKPRMTEEDNHRVRLAIAGYSLKTGDCKGAALLLAALTEPNPAEPTRHDKAAA